MEESSDFRSPGAGFRAGCGVSGPGRADPGRRSSARSRRDRVQAEHCSSPWQPREQQTAGGAGRLAARADPGEQLQEEDGSGGGGAEHPTTGHPATSLRVPAERRSAAPWTSWYRACWGRAAPASCPPRCGACAAAGCPELWVPWGPRRGGSLFCLGLELQSVGPESAVVSL